MRKRKINCAYFKILKKKRVKEKENFDNQRFNSSIVPLERLNRTPRSHS